MNRSEELDWLTMLREGATAGAVQATDTYVASYAWTISSAINPRVTSLSPYLSSLMISNLSWNLNFQNAISAKNRANSSGGNFQNPDLRFYYPDKMGVSLTASMAGTPYSTSSTTPPKVSPPKVATTTSVATTPGDSNEFNLPGIPRPPWKDPVQEEKPVTPGDINQLVPPVLNQRFTALQKGNNNIVFDYRITPSASSEMQYRLSTNSWQEADEVDWKEISSIMSRASLNVNTGISFSQTGRSYYRGSLRFTGIGAWQDYTYINEEADEFNKTNDIKNARTRMYNLTNFRTNYEFSTTLTPFQGNQIWGASNITYSINGLIGDYRFDPDASNVTDTEDDPQWRWNKGKFDEKDITSHQAGMYLTANIMDYPQTISITSTLPPKNYVIRGSATAKAWISETSVTSSISEPAKNTTSQVQPEDTSWKFGLIELSETLKFTNDINFMVSTSYNPEKTVKDWSSMRASLRLYGFNASYTASYMVPYELITGVGWSLKGDGIKEFSHTNLTFAYGKNLNINNIWDNRLSLTFNFNTNLNFNLQQYTYSKLTFSLSTTMKMTNFIDLNLSFNSENSQIYQYFKFLPFFTQDVPLPSLTEKNIFLDLLNSFRFDRDDLRKSSGFKLKTFSLNLVHHLGDWNAILGVTLSPYQYMDPTLGHIVWKFNNNISFLVQWIPIAEVKTEFVYNEEKLQFK